MEKEYHVNVHARVQRAAARINGEEISLQDALDIIETKPDPPYPRLEALLTTASKYPVAAIGVMVSIAAIVVGMVVTLAIAVIGGMFVMYGTMNQTTAKLDTVIKALDEAKTEQKVMRTYTASTLSRQNFMVGLMTRDQQKAISEYDKGNPVVNPKPDESRSQ